MESFTTSTLAFLDYFYPRIPGVLPRLLQISLVKPLVDGAENFLASHWLSLHESDRMIIIVIVGTQQHNTMTGQEQ